MAGLSLTDARASSPIAASAMCAATARLIGASSPDADDRRGDRVQ